MSKAEFDEMMGAHNVFNEQNRAALRGGEALRPTETSTTIRREGDTLTVTDGPFLETKEALGGYYLIEAQDLDAALAIAKQVPSPMGGVEVRPLVNGGRSDRPSGCGGSLDGVGLRARRHGTGRGGSGSGRGLCAGRVRQGAGALA